MSAYVRSTDDTRCYNHLKLEIQKSAINVQWTSEHRFVTVCSTPRNRLSYLTPGTLERLKNNIKASGFVVELRQMWQEVLLETEDFYDRQIVITYPVPEEAEGTRLRPRSPGWSEEFNAHLLYQKHFVQGL